MDEGWRRKKEEAWTELEGREVMDGEGGDDGKRSKREEGETRGRMKMM